MISVGTKLNVIDNSGAKIIECIKILGGSNKKYGFVGDIIVASVKKVNPLKKLKKGEIFKAVIVCTKKSKVRFHGDYVSFSINGAVIINNKKLPIGTRILSPVMLELRYKKFIKILSMAVVSI